MLVGLPALVVLGASVLLPLRPAAVLLVAAFGVPLVLLDPVWALYLAVLSVPVQEWLSLPGGLSLTQVALLLALASLALHSLAYAEQPLYFGRLLAPLALFVWALSLATVLTPYSRAEALRETVRWATVPLVYLLALRASEGRLWRTWGLVGCLLLAPSVTAVVGLVQYWFGLGPASFAIGGGHVRAYGTIGQPNSFAGYMNQAWPLAAGVTLFALVGLRTATARRTAWTTLLGAGVALGLTGAALLVSFSRGGWLGALGGALVMIMAALMLLPDQLRQYARRAVLVLPLGLVLLALLGGGGLLPAAVGERLTSLVGSLRLFDARGVAVTPANFAVVERMAHLQAGWNMLKRHPLSGVGPGNYSLVYAIEPGPDERPINVRPWYVSRGHAHNYYLHIAAEAGLVGLGAYLLLLLAVAGQALRALRAAQGWAWQGIAVGATGVIAAVAIHNLFENLHVLNMGLQLGSIWALLVIVERAAMECGLKGHPQ